MNDFELTAPVLFLVFNRLETAKRVLVEIKKARPRKLYIASDGPRKEKEGEDEKVKAVRDLLEKEIDWVCEVHKLYRDKNLGCKKAVSSAIDWFFENEEEGIVLEDDVLPSRSFFRFCQEMLEKYRDDTRVMHIGGAIYKKSEHNPQNYSYHFVRTGGIWGWASWRRAWKLYDVEMETWPEAQREKILKRLYPGERMCAGLYAHWFKRAYKNTHTWDYQWTYARLVNSSLNIIPARNLIENIGFGVEGATHTGKKKKILSELKREELDFPLIHPRFIVIDRRLNYENFKISTDNGEKMERLADWCKERMPKFVNDALRIAWRKMNKIF